MRFGMYSGRGQDCFRVEMGGAEDRIEQRTRKEGLARSRLKLGEIWEGLEKKAAADVVAVLVDRGGVV